MAWLIVAILVCANVVTFSLFWGLLSSQGNASEPLPGAPAPVRLFLPEAALTPLPTSTATRVVVYLATATKTPTPSPTETPTATSLPPTAAIIVPTEPPAQPTTQHVVIISIDGLRPDALDLTDTPTLDRLKSTGAYSARAQTVSLSITLPSHASMLSGMLPEKHGIVWGTPYIGWPGMNGPTLFNVAHDAGLSTAMVFGKEKLNYLVLPNSVDQLVGAEMGDPAIKEHTVELIEAGLPNILFVHFPDTDRVGHNFGWLSPNQLQSVTFVDGLIGELVAALESGGYLNNTLIIITADHGGHDHGHGDDTPEDRTIPWLAVGPGIRSGAILNSHINTYDTAATVLYALDLPIPENWDGRPILEIFD